jgi:hypothetical protein
MFFAKYGFLASTSQSASSWRGERSGVQTGSRPSKKVIVALGALEFHSKEQPAHNRPDIFGLTLVGGIEPGQVEAVRIVRIGLNEAEHRVLVIHSQLD